MITIVRIGINRETNVKNQVISETNKNWPGHFIDKWGWAWSYQRQMRVGLVISVTNEDGPGHNSDK